MMLIWIILGILLLVILLCFLPVGLFFRYEAKQLALQLTVSFWRIPLFPPREKEGRKKKPAKKGLEKKEAEPKREQTVKRPNRRQISYCLRTLPPLLKRALGGVGRRVKVSPFCLRIIFGGEDPADVANQYGKALILRESLLPALKQVVRLRGEEIVLDTDYTCEQTRISGLAGIQVRVGSLLWTGFALLRELFPWYKEYRKLGKTEEKIANNEKNQRAEAA